MAGNEAASPRDATRPRPWWESEITDRPLPAAVGPAPVLPDAGEILERCNGTIATVTQTPVDQAPNTGPDRLAGLTTRGAFLALGIAAFVGCLIGFVLQGATAIPALAGVGLVLGAVLTGLRVSPRLGWWPVWLPPLAMLAVIAVAGQLTILGTRPTLAREATMIVSNLATTAPYQVAAMLVIAAFVGVRRRRTRAAAPESP